MKKIIALMLMLIMSVAVLASCDSVESIYIGLKSGEVQNLSDMLSSGSLQEVLQDLSDVLPTEEVRYLPDVVPAYQTDGQSNTYELSDLKTGGAKYVSMAGVEYKNAIRICGFSGYLLYNLNGSYSQLSGVIGHLDEQNNDAPIQIWCDGVLRVEFSLPRDEYPQEFTIDLRGVSQLKICRSSSRSNTDVVIGNPVLK